MGARSGAVLTSTHARKLEGASKEAAGRHANIAHAEQGTCWEQAKKLLGPLHKLVFKENVWVASKEVARSGTKIGQKWSKKAVDSKQSHYSADTAPHVKQAKTPLA
jgi:hypothetical protein